MKRIVLYIYYYFMRYMIYNNGKSESVDRLALSGVSGLCTFSCVYKQK